MYTVKNRLCVYCKKQVVGTQGTHWKDLGVNGTFNKIFVVKKQNISSNYNQPEHLFCSSTQSVLTNTIIHMCKSFTCFMRLTVRFLNFQTLKIFAVIYLKFKQRGHTLGYFVKMMQME